jgi:hypothetical protein
MKRKKDRMKLSLSPKLLVERQDETQFITRIDGRKTG